MADTTDFNFLVLSLQVQLVQSVIDGVTLLIDMEKRLEWGRGIEDLIPSAKSTQV